MASGPNGQEFPTLPFLVQISERRFKEGESRHADAIAVVLKNAEYEVDR